jgi:hypothetical protein
VVIVLENISLLLNEALSPYLVSVGPVDTLGNRLIAVKDQHGLLMAERLINRSQLTDNRTLIDVVDGFHRDLLVAEGRLQPCVIAALQHAAQSRQVFSAGM